MKKHIFLLIGGLFLTVSAKAFEASTRDLPLADIQPSTYTYCLSISTSAWTQFPAATVTPLRGRDGIWLYDLNSNTASMEYAITKSSNTTSSAKPPTPASTTQVDGIIIKGADQKRIDVPDSMSLFLRSLHTSAETICGREYRK